jgi:GGDEF domain-containing protein
MPALEISEVVVWCMLMGAMLMLVLLCLTEYVRQRERWAMESGIYVALLMVVTLSGSGLAQMALGRAYSGHMSVALGVLPPLSMVVGALSIRNWLRTRGREQLVDWSLVCVSVVCGLAVAWAVVFPVPVDALGHPRLPDQWRTPNEFTPALAWGTSWLAILATTFGSLRVALHGDKRAWFMFAVCMLCAPMSMLLSLRLVFAWAAPIEWVALTVLSQGVGACVLVRHSWERHRILFNANRILEDERGIDPLTRLPSGGALISQMEQAYSRAHKLMRHRPVLVAVQLFNAEEIVKECGDNGWNQVVLATLARIRRVVSPADLVGRYYGGCFVILISSRVTAQYLRGLGLRLASSARRPVTPRVPPSGFESDEPIETDVGVGLFWCDAVGDLTMALHEAERAAEAARGMRSRAAVVLRPRSDAIAVERALGEAQLKGSLRERSFKRMADWIHKKRAPGDESTEAVVRPTQPGAKPVKLRVVRGLAQLKAGAASRS